MDDIRSQDRRLFLLELLNPRSLAKEIAFLAACWGFSIR